MRERERGGEEGTFLSILLKFAGFSIYHFVQKFIFFAQNFCTEI